MAGAGVIVGLISGFLVVAYRLGIEYGTETARWMYARICETPWLVAPWTLAAVLAALAIAWMVKREPMAGGSGIPQTNGVVMRGLKMRWQTILPVRFIGGLLCSVCRSAAKVRPFRLERRAPSFFPIGCVAGSVRTCRSTIWSPPAPQPAFPPRSALHCPA